MLMLGVGVGLAGYAAALPKPHTPSPSAQAAGEGVDPYAGLTPAEAVAMRWEEEAMRRGGRMVCTNPKHHHSMSPQTHWLIEEDGNSGPAVPDSGP